MDLSDQLVELPQDIGGLSKEDRNTLEDRVRRHCEPEAELDRLGATAGRRSSAGRVSA